ncbi:MAG: hypothetical protein ACLT2T_09360 [Bilophila wadsworthia]
MIRTNGCSLRVRSGSGRPYDPDYEAEFLPIQGHVDGLYTDRELEHPRPVRRR